MVIVSDTTAISNLFLSEKLWILEQVFGEIILPKAVFDELERLETKGVSIDFIRQQQWIQVVEVKNKSLVEILEINLDKGEAEAIALAKEIDADFLIIDELKGRNYAKQLNIKIIGLLGVLLKAKENGIISNIKEILAELRNKAGFWLNNELFETVLKLANEK